MYCLVEFESEVMSLEWKQEQTSLSLRESSASADVRRALSSLRDLLGPSAFHETIGKELTESESLRRTWSESLWNQLKNIRGVASTSTSSVVKSAMTAFKRSNKDNFEALRSEELRLNEFLFGSSKKEDDEEDEVGLGRMFEGWLAEGGCPVNNAPMSARRPRSAGIPPKTCPTPTAEEQSIRQALDALGVEIERDGGANGGWSPEEHAVFLRTISRGENLETNLPHFSAESIRDHREWYARHQGRLLLKKRLLADWRANRDAQLARQRADQDAFNVDLEAEKEAKDVARAEALAEQAATRLKVEEWRLAKEEKEARDQAALKEKEYEEKEKARQEAAYHSKIKRDVIAEMKAEKVRIATELRLANEELRKRELEERKALAQMNKVRIEERVVQIATRRKELQKAKEESREKKKIAQMLLVQGQREELNAKVTSKHMDITDKVEGELEKEKLQVERYLDRFGKRRAESFGGQVVHIPTRAVPSWRQAVN